MKPKSKYGIPPHLMGRDVIGRGKHRTVIALGRKRAIKVENRPFLFRKGSNQLEWENYQRYFARVPPHLKRFFVTLSRSKVVDGYHTHQTRIIKDFNGERSQQLKQTGPITNAYFWDCFDRIRAWMAQEKIPFYDFTPKNILVKKVSPTKWIPVIIDYEGTGPNSMPLQFWLRLPFFSRLKANRRAARLEQSYRATK